MLFTQIDPETYIDTDAQVPLRGRGVWNRIGKANYSWRYEYLATKPTIGSNAQVSLDAWATCAGSYGYQLILIKRGYLRELGDKEKGLFGPETKVAVMAMQKRSKDPETGAWLDPDGTIGTGDARAMLTPILDDAERTYDIPTNFLRGETALESRLDCGALGSFIYYGETKSYRGVDRGISQINSEANAQVTWQQAFDPYYSIDWSGSRLRGAFDRFQGDNPKQSTGVLWDAALCNHNNPSAARRWAQSGSAPTDAAAAYVANAKAARY